MPQYSEEITALLRALLWDEPLHIDTAVLMQPGLWQAACRYQLDNMLAVWALNKGLDIFNPAYQKQRIFINLQRKQRQNKLLTDLVTLLRQHDIEPVLLKGYGLELLYENPDMRVYSDVDIYIGEQNYNRAVQIVRSYYPDAHWCSESEGVMHFIMVLDDNIERVVELHRVTMEFSGTRANRAWQQFTLDEMRHTRTIEINGVNVSIPSTTYNAIYVFIHAWHHFASSGVGLRQLADWMLTLRTTINTEALHDILRQLHMLEVWQTFGWVLVNRFGLNSEEFPFYSDSCSNRGERLYRQLLTDGHGGRLSRFKLLSWRMYRFPFSRPAHGRLWQKIYTFCRLTFNAFQRGKCFPKYAFYEYLDNVLQKRLQRS